MDRQHLRSMLQGVARETYLGFLTVTRNSLALLGLAVICFIIFVLGRSESLPVLNKLSLKSLSSPAQGGGEGLPEAVNFLAGALSVPAEKLSALLGLQPDVTPANGATEEAQSSPSLHHVAMGSADKTQLAIGRYLVRKYRISSEAVELLVSAAYETGKETGLDPALLLAVMAIESGFNPFAESVMGAQGLMQVMSKVHHDKLEDFGGARAALNPVANMKVGAQILKDCIRRGGSLADGLRLYVGAGMGDDGGYGARVMQERERIALSARGIAVAALAPPAIRPAVAGDGTNISAKASGNVANLADVAIVRASATTLASGVNGKSAPASAPVVVPGTPVSVHSAPGDGALGGNTKGAATGQSYPAAPTTQSENEVEDKVAIL